MHDKIHRTLGRDTRYFAFTINHRCSGTVMDIKERNGTVSGIFSGYRFIEPKDL